MTIIINPFAFGGPPPACLLDGLSGVTGAYSASRKLLAAYGGAFYSGTTSAVTALKNQNGSTDLTVGGTITVANTGPNSRAAFNNAATGFAKSVSVAISSFFSNSDGYVAASMVAAAFATNNASSYGNHCVVGDTTQGYMGQYLKNNATYLAYNFDSNDDHVDIAVSVATTLLLEWWHTGGNVFGRVNGSGAGASVPSGNTGVMTGELCAFVGAPSSQRLLGSIWEIVVRNTAGTSGERDAIAAGMKSWVGASALITTAFDGAHAFSTLSNGNLTATYDASSNNNGGAKSTTALSTGKYYFEVLTQNGTQHQDFLGVQLTGNGFNFGDFTGFGTVLLLGSSSVVLYSNGAATAKTWSTTTVGDRWGLAIDLAAKLAWFRRNGGNWNNDGAADPVAGVGGVTIAAGSFVPAVRFAASLGNQAFTANFGATAYTYTPPTGYGNWV